MREKFIRLVSGINASELNEISEFLLTCLGYGENGSTLESAVGPDDETCNPQYGGGELPSARKSGVQGLLERVYAAPEFRDEETANLPLYRGSGSMVPGKQIGVSGGQQFPPVATVGGKFIVPEELGREERSIWNRQAQNHAAAAEAERLSQIVERDSRRYDAGFVRY